MKKLLAIAAVGEAGTGLVLLVYRLWSGYCSPPKSQAPGS